eukprot:TRINITY_DN12848_c0_g1_i1.p1 TRINITY_DN12848_c0_g1~~TRINITY_DN12848_c0_g1_i1.p1  ORF type:complete len:355 (+),score=51.38 TRINITY_DN12848_c0_g1_i1:13-1077(+)
MQPDNKDQQNKSQTPANFSQNDLFPEPPPIDYTKQSHLGGYPPNSQPNVTDPNAPFTQQHNYYNPQNPQQPYTAYPVQPGYQQQYYNDNNQLPYQSFSYQQSNPNQTPTKPIVVTVIDSDSDSDDDRKKSKNFSYMNQDPERRLLFVRKVLMIVATQIMVVALISIIFKFALPTEFTQQGWIFWVAFAVEIVSLLILLCVSKKFPVNVISFSVFTFASGVLVGQAVTYYSVPTIMEAFIVTFVTTVSLIGYTIFEKKDFRFLNGAIVALTCIICFWAIFMFLIPSMWLYVAPPPLWSYLISLVFIVLFMMYLLYDVSILMHQLHESEYLLGALQIYLDILNLFLCILSIFGSDD